MEGDCEQSEKMTSDERMVLGRELQKLINTYSGYENCDSGYIYTGVYYKKLFQMKIFELCSVIIIKFINVNEKYFGLRQLEKLDKILERMLRIDYRREKESMVRIRALIKFCEID
ncbi:MAG TPA: hypothetical protein VLL98_04425 [Rickettsiales bacterium]|nr:hypothetical protein [Rickettsiales bacterium]